jgi:hypothetical protein
MNPPEAAVYPRPKGEEGNPEPRYLSLISGGCCISNKKKEGE